MHLREKPVNKPFTGFVACYEDGKRIQERENFFSDKLNKQCSTNWAEICREKLSSMELLWNGISKIKIDKVNYPSLKPSDWYFSQTGYMDLLSKNIVVVSRNIGYRKDGILNIFYVEENTGIVKSAQRAA